MFRLLYVFLSILPLLVWGHTAQADTPAEAPSSQITPQQATRLLNVLRDPQQREQFTNTLELMGKALLPEAPAKAVVPLAPDSLGAMVLTQSGGWLSRVVRQTTSAMHTIADIPRLWAWLGRQVNDPAARNMMWNNGLKLVAVLGIALAIEYAAHRLLRKPLRHIEHYAANADKNSKLKDTLPTSEDVDVSAIQDANTRRKAHMGIAWRTLHRLPFILAHFIVDILPIGLFYLIGNVLLETSLGTPTRTQLAIAGIVEAVTFMQLIMAVIRLVILPSSPLLRLVRISDASALYLERWSRRIGAVVVFGTTLAQTALLFGLYRSAEEDIMKLVMLIAHLLVVVMIVQCRHSVARYIHARPGQTNLMSQIRNRLAQVWHWIAIFYILAVWVVWATEIRDGFTWVWHNFIISVLIVVLARVIAIIALGALYRGMHVSPAVEERYTGLEARLNRYVPLLRGVITVALTLLMLLTLLQGWGINVWGWFVTGSVGIRLLSASAVVLTVLIIAAIVWEMINAALEDKVTRLSDQGDFARVARLRTLLPILKTALLIVICSVVVLTSLSEIGVDIAPLLAGAGIVGVALGFGSQKLVQDLITGLFLLLEHAMQVGDTVTVSGLTGVVEHLSIRTIRLRAGDGSVHIIPFSAVTSVTNANRGIGQVVVSVAVSAEEDFDRVRAALVQIGAEMREDSKFSAQIIADFSFLGMDQINVSTMVVMGQISCIDTARATVQREFNLRVYKLFRQLDIRLSVTTQGVVVYGDTSFTSQASPPTPA